MILDSIGIQKILPHRYPFLLVDAIEEMEPKKRIVGIKNVTRSAKNNGWRKTLVIPIKRTDTWVIRDKALCPELAGSTEKFQRQRGVSLFECWLVHPAGADIQPGGEQDNGNRQIMASVPQALRQQKCKATAGRIAKNDHVLCAVRAYQV